VQTEHRQTDATENNTCSQQSWYAGKNVTETGNATVTIITVSPAAVLVADEDDDYDDQNEKHNRQQNQQPPEVAQVSNRQLTRC